MMKYAYLLLVGLLAVAATSQARSVPDQDETYIREHIKGLWELIKGKASVHIEELKRQKEDLTKRLREAHADAKEEIKKKLEEVKNDLTKAYQEFIAKMKEIFSKNEDTDDTYFKDLLWEKLTALKNLIAEKGAILRDIITEIGKATSEKAKIHLQEQKEIILTELARLRDELLRKIREAMIPDDDTYAMEDSDYFITDLIEQIKGHIEVIKGQIAEQREIIRKSVGEQKALALKHLKELQEELSGMWNDLKNAIREIFNKKETTYAMDDSDYFITDLIEQIKGHIAVIKEQIAEQREIIRKSVGEQKALALKHLKELQEQLSGMWNDLKEAIKEIFNKKETTYAMDDTYIINTIKEIRGLLNEKLQQIKDLAEVAKIGADMAKQEALKAIAALRVEIAQLRDELIQKIKDMFKRDEPVY